MSGISTYPILQFPSLVPRNAHTLPLVEEPLHKKFRGLPSDTTQTTTTTTTNDHNRPDKNYNNTSTHHIPSFAELLSNLESSRLAEQLVGQAPRVLPPLSLPQRSFISVGTGSSLPNTPSLSKGYLNLLADSCTEIDFEAITVPCDYTNGLKHKRSATAPTSPVSRAGESGPIPINPKSFLASLDTVPLSEQFELTNQPNPIQRKTYKYEHRYLLPNPLIVQLKEGNKVVDAVVSVKLIDDKTGDEVAGIDDSCLTIQALHPSTSTAQFALKVVETSCGCYFRLLFLIKYKLEGSSSVYEEKLISNKFKVMTRPQHCKESQKIR